MNDSAIYDRYRHLPSNEIIKQIVRLAETRHTSTNREFACVVVNWIEDCKQTKNGRAIDDTLRAILRVKCNYTAMVTVLRSSFSVRNSLTQWYITRNKVAAILLREEPERAARIMVGLQEPDPHKHEEMDGLNAWESILKECAKYAVDPNTGIEHDA